MCNQLSGTYKILRFRWSFSQIPQKHYRSCLTMVCWSQLMGSWCLRLRSWWVVGSFYHRKFTVVRIVSQIVWPLTADQREPQLCGYSWRHLVLRSCGLLIVTLLLCNKNSLYPAKKKESNRQLPGWSYTEVTSRPPACNVITYIFSLFYLFFPFPFSFLERICLIF